MAMATNRVELAGSVERINGGKTRTGGYWLLMSVEICDDDRSVTVPVWWFGEEGDYDMYTGVAEGDELEVVGELRWGRNRDEEWELRVIALSFGVVERKRNGRGKRNDRDDRKERSDRRERSERRERKRNAEDEEPPF